MNETLKKIITNPFVIGGTMLGLGGIGAATIWAFRRPKTDAEIELEKTKEANAEAARQRAHELELEKIKNRQTLDEIEAQEATKREAKKQEELTERARIQLKADEEQREYERTAPQGYWELQIAKAKAAGEEAAAKKEADIQREIARLQAESAKYTADANARAIKDREYYSYRRAESNNNADAAKVQSMFGSLATMVTGTNSPAS